MMIEYCRADPSGVWYGCDRDTFVSIKGYDIWKWRESVKITDEALLTKLSVLSLLTSTMPADWIPLEGMGYRYNDADNLIQLQPPVFHSEGSTQ